MNWSVDTTATPTQNAPSKPGSSKAPLIADATAVTAYNMKTIIGESSLERHPSLPVPHDPLPDPHLVTGVGCTPPLTCGNVEAERGVYAKVGKHETAVVSRDLL
jgi:hypothetical protein